MNGGEKNVDKKSKDYTNCFHGPFDHRVLILPTELC